MNYPQFRKILDPMLTPLSEGEKIELLKDEHEATEENLAGYILAQEEKVEKIIAGLPYLKNSDIINISRWAGSMRRVLKKRKEKTLKGYQGYQDAVLHGVTKDCINESIDAVINRYEYLSRVALGIVGKRLGRDGNMLPLDKTKWLER